MRFEDERYVRVYTRDTLTWLGLGWQGQAVLSLLFRKVDRAGLLEIGSQDPAVALAAVTGVPLEHCRAAWDRLSDGEEPTVAVINEPQRALFIPKFLAAQEANQSDKARAAKSREMARARAALNNTTLPSSQSVTESHTRSHAVTLSCAVPSRAVPSPELHARREDAPAPAAACDEVQSEFVKYVLAEWPDVKDPAEFERRARAAFPALSPLSEARKARGWELSSPKRRKYDHGKFLWGWLGRAQDQSSRPASEPGPMGGQQRNGAHVVHLDSPTPRTAGRKLV